MIAKKRTRAKSKSTARNKSKAPKKITAARTTKKQTCLTMLARGDGATIEQLQKATGWQPHSVRGFLAGVAKRQPEQTLTSDKVENKARRYRLVAEGVGQ